MSFNRHACYFLPPHYSRTAANYIWISDEVLNSVYQCFTQSRISRRYGSSVPGPLEAQRRATKRRMMGLAKTGGGEVGAIHPSFLAGLNPGRDVYGWKWQPPTSLPEVPETEPNEANQLPSWLQQIDVPPLTPSNSDKPSDMATHFGPDHPIPKIRGIKNAHAWQCTQHTKDVPRYFEGLDTCKSLEDFRRAAANLDPDIHSKLVFSESAFRQLLVTECRLEVFLQFLSDPFLNARESQNLQHLWRWYMKEARDKIDSAFLHNWLRNHIALGMLSKKELEDLVDTSGNHPEIGLCQSILDGLLSSAVYQVSDLQGWVLNRLLLSASRDECWRNPEMQSLSFKILEACEPPQYKNMVEGISSLLTSYLLSESPDRGICSLESQVSKTLDCLLSRSQIQASKAIASASKAVLKRFESSASTRSLLKRNLSGWWSFLLHHEKFEFIRHRPEWLRIERALAQHDIDALCLYIKHLSDDEKCVFLLRHWFTQNVGDGDIFRPGNLPDSVRLFQDDLVSRAGTECPFIFLFHYLGPAFSTAGSMFPRLFSLFNELEMHETSLALFSYIRQSKTTIEVTALANKIINSTSINPQVACTLFKITPSLPLESCPGVAEMMIYHPGWNPGVPLGFLDLRQENLGVSDVYPHTPQEICRTQIELLNRMALAYAHASHIYPRVALRQVYHCYQLLIRRHGRSSLGVDISRAFTVAGVIRPLQESQWVGIVKLKFILKIVREIEGKQVALRVDELIYMWRDELIRKRAEEASKMQLARSLGLDGVEVTKEVERATETSRDGKRKVEASRVIAGEPLEKLPGEMNADRFVRVHGAMNLARARTVQNTALKENGIAEGLQYR